MNPFEFLNGMWYADEVYDTGDGIIFQDIIQFCNLPDDKIDLLFKDESPKKLSYKRT